jgi:hypothetical protein
MLRGAMLCAIFFIARTVDLASILGCPEFSGSEITSAAEAATEGKH